ncbi:MAG: chemotaxis response regulator protein-glutamate methylesterase [Lachnospiraceae bacterium]|nr:chemotaxis response regulator protein-glutamate methylesterase [Lachnospiraceae bacterium]
MLNCKKILVVDDSALMRRVLGDIIESDGRFQVADRAKDGKEALELLKKNRYDAVVLDVNMPVMNGLELLRELQRNKIAAKVLMASTDTKEGAKVTMDALELGALDFIHKPSNALNCKEDSFKQDFIRLLAAVANGKEQKFVPTFSIQKIQESKKLVQLVSKHSTTSGNKLIAIASSTGGPKALQSVIPKLPKNINAPVLIVQHMPQGFTKSLAERLDSLSEVSVKEAEDGDALEKGKVYIARGGVHMNVDPRKPGMNIFYSDQPTREGVKPCANYMYESLIGSKYDEIVCVVMTGMGADGTEGIKNLSKTNKIRVIAQEESTCAVYGMPKSIVNSGLADQVVGLEDIAQEIIMNVGVR